MRMPRILLPIALSLTLVGCDAWMQPTPVDDSMMRDDTMIKKDDAMMDDDSMMKDDAMMDGREGEWTDEEMKAMEDGGHMMNDDGMKKDDAMMKAEGDAMMKGDGDAMMKKEDQAMMAKGSYTAYTPEVLTNGDTKVLFFHAAWCPSCKKGDASLNAWYRANTYDRSVYKVDYDNSNDLKAKYGVTYQHTFVLVDGQGNALQVIQGPTDAQLQAMLQA